MRDDARGQLVYTLRVLRRHSARSANLGPPTLGRARTHSRAKTIVWLDGKGHFPGVQVVQTMGRSCTKCFSPGEPRVRSVGLGPVFTMKR